MACDRISFQNTCRHFIERSILMGTEHEVGGPIRALLRGGAGMKIAGDYVMELAMRKKDGTWEFNTSMHILQPPKD